MVVFILNISIVNLFKQSNEVALFLPFSATYGVGGAPGRTANIHFQFRRFENAVGSDHDQVCNCKQSYNWSACQKSKSL